MKRFVRFLIAHGFASYVAMAIVTIWTIQTSGPSPSNWALTRYLRL